MTGESILKRALAEQWQDLPASLQAHYTADDNTDVGTLDIDYPAWMQPLLHLLYLFGALLNRKGQGMKTTVEKKMLGERQCWKRTITLPSGKTMYFTSTWYYDRDNRLIEYVNPVMGLCMSVHVEEGKLHYHGEYFVFNFFGLKLPLPEWLLLGHTHIVETAVDEDHFQMDFRLLHPLFGQVYRYAGQFNTVRIK